MAQHNEDPKIIDVEVIEDHKSEGGQSRQRAYKRTIYTNGRYRTSFQGNGFSGFMSAAPINASGCMAPAITLGLFIVCLGQFGLFAAISFFVFHLIGAIMGSIHQARLLIAGLPASPWPWRVGNWVVSFLITMWLAGGIGG